MPPQVNGPGPARRPAVVHSQDGVEQTKSSKSSDTQHDATTPCAPHRPNPKEKSQKNAEMSVSGSAWFTELAKTLGELENKQAEKVKESAKIKGKPSFDQMEQLKANSQELSTVSHVVQDSINSMGNSISTASKKQ
jgi:hypothetical protein